MTSFGPRDYYKAIYVGTELAHALNYPSFQAYNYDCRYCPEQVKKRIDAL